MIDKLSKQLEGLYPGYRGCFWCCMEVQEGEPPIIFASSQNNISQELKTLEARAHKIRCFEEAFPLMGLVGVNLHGKIQLSGRDLPKALIPFLADWVRLNIKEYPNISQLKNLEIVEMDQKGKWSPIHMNVAAWEGIKGEPPKGSMLAGLQMLRSLQPMEEANFWMVGQSIEKLPFFALTTKQEDPDLTLLKAKISYVRAHLDSEKTVVMGSIMKLESGRYVLLTTSSLDLCIKILDRIFTKYLEEIPLLGLLGDIRILRLENDEVVEHKAGTWQVDNIVEQAPKINSNVSILDRWDGKERLSFFFGEDVLLIDESGATLKARLLDAGLKKGYSGRLRRSSKGFIELHTSKDNPSLLKELVVYVQENLAKAPSLRHFNLARHVVKNKAGELVARYKEDSAWAKIPFSP